MMTSCEIEMSSHGNLYGFWHLESIDSMKGGIKDLSSQSLFWSVQAELIECSDKDLNNQIILFKFQRIEDSLSLGEPRFNDREKGDPAVTDITLLSPYGINSFQPVFNIVELKTDRLILSDETVRLNFKKF